MPQRECTPGPSAQDRHCIDMSRQDARFIASWGVISGQPPQVVLTLAPVAVLVCRFRSGPLKFPLMNGEIVNQ